MTSLTPTFLEPKELIQRFLHTNTYNGVFCSGRPPPHQRQDHKYLCTFVNEDPSLFIQIMIEENKTPTIQRRGNMFLLIAIVLNNVDISQASKNKIKPLVLALLKKDTEFFDFIYYFTSISKKKIGKTLKKMIVKFYRNKRPLELAKCVTSFKGRHKWTHKDLIKLCHLKMEDPCSTLIIKYVLYGIKALEGVVCWEMIEVLDILRNAHTMRTSKDGAEAASLMSTSNADVCHVNSKLNKSEDVWAATIPQLTLREILQRLPKMYKWGFLKAGSICQTQIIPMLNNLAKVTECRLHPIEVYIFLRQFEKGGKGLDPKLEDWLTQNAKGELATRLKNPLPPKCSIMVQNVNRALTLAYQNLKSTNKHFFIGLDTTGSHEDVCFQNKRITSLEAAATIMRCLIKYEKNVTVGVLANDNVRLVHFSKAHNVPEMVKKLTTVSCTFALQNSAFEWAVKNKRHYDVFIILMSKKWASRVPTSHKERAAENFTDAFDKYTKTAKNAKDAKLVRMFLTDPKAAVKGSTGTRNILSMAGFTHETPWVLDSFINGHFC